MKKLCMAALAVATIAMVGCKKTEKTDYLKNLDGYWVAETVTDPLTALSLEVDGTTATLSTTVTDGQSFSEAGTLSYNATTGEGVISFKEQSEGSLVNVASVNGDKKSITLTIIEGDKTVFDGKLTKTVKPDPQPGAGTPDLDKPAAGMVRFAIQIPAGSECNGIAFKGTFDGTAWSGENTYCDGAQNAQADPTSCVKFSAIEGYDNWYTADYQLGSTPWGDNSDIYMAGKICLIYTGDGSWQGQFIDWAYDESYTTAAVSKSDDGNIQVNGEGLVYVTIGGWQMSECAAAEKYNVTVKTPTCGTYPLEIIGGFDNWTGTAMTANEDSTIWTVTIEAQANAEYKFRQVGTWDNEIQEYNEEEAAWKGLANQKLADQHDIEFDFTDAAKYKWTLCE